MKKFFLDLFYALAMCFESVCKKAAHLQCAITQNPVIGRAKRSAGGMTFTTLFGQNIMKAKVFQINDKKSSAQIVIRTLQKTCVAFAAGLKTIARDMFDVQPASMSAYSRLIQQIQLVFMAPLNLGWKNTLVLGAGLDTLPVLPNYFTTSLGKAFSFIVDFSEFSFSESFEPRITIILFNLTQAKVEIAYAMSVDAQVSLSGTFPSSWVVGDDVICMYGVLTQTGYKTMKFKPGADLANKVK